MAELLIVVVVVVALLIYAADRALKLRARARRLAGMNDRLDAAAAKVDQEQQRRQAKARASAELTSVLPAIKRPPLTLPGMGGLQDEPEEDEAAEAPRPAGDAAPAAQEAGDAGQLAGDAGQETGDAGDTTDRPDAPGEERAAGPADEPPAGERPAPPAPRLTDDTLSMPAGMTATDLPAVPGIQVTTEGTLIMRPVPGQGPAPAGEILPAPDARPDEPAPSQKRTGRR